MEHLALFVISFWIVILSQPILGCIRNYSTARKIGLPIRFSPASLTNPTYPIIWENLLSPLFRRLPFGLGKFLNVGEFTVHFTHRYRYHAELGPAYTIVTPGDIQIFLADAAAADDMLSRSKKDFIKSESVYKPMELFGANVNTSNGEIWARHRRLTSPPFNERNSSHVWRVSLSQASEMLEAWMKDSKGWINSLKSDFLTLALHVLMSAGFGKSYSFEGGLANVSEGHTMTYRDSIQLLLNNMYPMFFLSSLKIPSFLLPARYLAVKNAIGEFRSYLVELVENERKSYHAREDEKDNLLSSLVRLSEAGMTGRRSLSDEEIYGNLFIYNVGGHDSTANILSYAIGMLAIHPQYQSWVREELDAVLPMNMEPEDWAYEEVFPQLKRCLAVMLETMRLYAPFFLSLRYTGDKSTALTIGGKLYNIPPDVNVIAHVICLGTLPEYWGSDALQWKPDRWILNETPGDINTEKFFQPVSGSFIPWSSGPRVCPGKKFSQIEFAAVMARLFRKHGVTPMVDEGQSLDEAKKKIMEAMEDSHLTTVLKMRHPQRIKLSWEEIF